MCNKDQVYIGTTLYGTFALSWCVRGEDKGRREGGRMVITLLNLMICFHSSPLSSRHLREVVKGETCIFQSLWFNITVLGVKGDKRELRFYGHL
jgi:hypothetical protein